MVRKKIIVRPISKTKALRTDLKEENESPTQYCSWPFGLSGQLVSFVTVIGASRNARLTRGACVAWITAAKETNQCNKYFYLTITPWARVGYEMVKIANEARRAEFVITNLISKKREWNNNCFIKFSTFGFAKFSLSLQKRPDGFCGWTFVIRAMFLSGRRVKTLQTSIQL